MLLWPKIENHFSGKPHLFKRMGLFAILMPLVFFGNWATAQINDTTSEGEVVSNFTVDRDVFGGGIFYYTIVEQDSFRVISRGTHDVEGIDRIILAPNTAYRMLSFYAETLSFGNIGFTTPAAGRTFQIACMDYIFLENPPDADLDDLPDLLESIVGTNPDNPDTDNDGFIDGQEVMQGRDPLDGFIAETGIVASGPTPGDAIDICTINNIAIVACGTEGVAVFNVRNGASPVRIAQVNTPGFAQRVACFSNYIAVADGTSGLAVIDIADPPAAEIIHQVNFGGSEAVGVTAQGTTAFVLLATGEVVMVDMVSGIEISRYDIGNFAVQDLGVRGNYLYVLASNRFIALSINDGDFLLQKSIALSGTVGAARIRWRLFMGVEYAFASESRGFNRINIEDPADPFVEEHFTTAQVGWKQIIPDGSANAIVVASPNSTLDGPHHIDLYDIGAGNDEATYLTTLETPSVARAASLYNGLVYVADSSAGIHVMNYLAFDTLGIPPTITLTTDAVDGLFEEGKVITASAEVMDDVHIRSVEFYVDGVPIALDGNYPFELGLVAPTITDEKSSFTIFAVVSDTGGNTAVSEELTIQLVPDATPPFVRSVRPRDGTITGDISSILVLFSEPLDASTISGRSVRLISAGPDNVMNTADDFAYLGSTRRYQADNNSLTLTNPNPYEPARYQLLLADSITDLAGNALSRAVSSTFQVYGFTDSDGDGVPDDLEESLGYDVSNPDTDGDGISDGLEDFDNDGLPNVGEVILNKNPEVADTDDNGIDDGDEDGDFDGLNDGDEIRNGTDPSLVDTDGDGIDDLTEILEGFDPNDASSKFPTSVSSHLLSYLNSVFANSGEEIVINLTSAPVSFVNGVSAIIEEEIVVSLASAPVSYVNGLITDLEENENVVRSVVSPLVSYVNGVLEQTDDEPVLVFSPLYSFENSP